MFERRRKKVLPLIISCGVYEDGVDSATPLSCLVDGGVAGVDSESFSGVVVFLERMVDFVDDF